MPTPYSDWYAKRHPTPTTKPYVAYPGRPWVSEAVKKATTVPTGGGQFGAGYNVGGGSKPATAQGFGGYYNTSMNAPKTPEVVKDASYYMGQAQNLLTGVDYSGLRDRAQSSVSDVDARVKAMYRAMRGIQAEEAANREASRTAAGESITQSADKAASDIQQGYDNAISSLADEMAALGIGETLAQEPAQRVAAESGRQQAISRQLGQISGNLNTELGQGESAFNQQTRDITGQEGADFRSQLQSDLLNRLAELDMAQQQQNQTLPQQQMAYAQQLRSYDQSFEPYTPSFSEQLDAAKISGSASAAQQKRFDDAFFKFFAETKDEAKAYQMAQDYINGISQ